MLNRPGPRRRPRRAVTRCPTAHKVCYSHELGLKQLALMKESECDPDPYRVLHVYRCPHGDHYHIGHRPKHMDRPEGASGRA